VKTIVNPFRPLFPFGNIESIFCEVLTYSDGIEFFDDAIITSTHFSTKSYIHNKKETITKKHG
jgi:hypothetical protein